MDWLILLLVAAVSGAFGYLAWRWTRARRLAYIDSFEFHEAIRKRVHDRRPTLSERDMDLVLLALRDYFHICARAGRRLVSMPSQVVDDAWHEMILFTRSYQEFCRKAFGRFLHHTPAEAMKRPTRAQEGIRRAWRLACAREGIDPRVPDRLPSLFQIDSLLNIENGFTYVPDCTGQRKGDGYCASHIGCATGCGGGFGGEGSDGGFFDGFGDSGGGDGGGGGCGGD